MIFTYPPPNNVTVDTVAQSPTLSGSDGMKFAVKSISNVLVDSEVAVIILAQ